MVITTTMHPCSALLMCLTSAPRATSTPQPLPLQRHRHHTPSLTTTATYRCCCCCCGGRAGTTCTRPSHPSTTCCRCCGGPWRHRAVWCHPFVTRGGDETEAALVALDAGRTWLITAAAAASTTGTTRATTCCTSAAATTTSCCCCCADGWCVGAGVVRVVVADGTQRWEHACVV
jgi:hypothetical protein